MEAAPTSRPGQAVQELTLSLGREDWRELGMQICTENGAFLYTSQKHV